MGMSGVRQFEPHERAITVGKAILALSFLLPYLINYSGPEDLNHFIIYAPIWVFGQMENQFFGGPHPFALIMFTFWLPIVLMGYQSYRFANGKCSSMKSYILSIFILIIVNIFFTLPMIFTPTGYTHGEEIYSTIIPLPIIPILSLILIPILQPTEISGPWRSQPENVEKTEKPDDNSHWID